MREPFELRGRPSEGPVCVRCLRLGAVLDLDRLLWCRDCVARARSRTGRRAVWAGAATALVVGLYVVLGVRPDFSLIPAAWAGVVLGAGYLGFRLAREILYGWERIRNQPAVEATPPTPGGADDGG